MNSLCVRRANVRVGAAVLLTTIVLVLLAAGPAAAAGQPTWVANSPPSSATVGVAYSYQYVAQSPPGDPPPVYAVAVAGSLPSGLALDRSTGVLSGTPAAAGDFDFRILAVNDPSFITSPRTTISVARGQQQIVITSSAPAPALVGTTYQVTAVGGASGNPVVFSRNANSTEGACEVSASGSVTFTGVGTCIVNAFQAGDANYDPARASQTVIVSPVPSPSPSTSRLASSSRPHSPARPATAPAISAAHGQLAMTGTSAVGPATAGMALGIAGLMLVVASGRRRDRRRP